MQRRFRLASEERQRPQDLADTKKIVITGWVQPHLLVGARRNRRAFLTRIAPAPLGIGLITFEPKEAQHQLEGICS